MYIYMNIRERNEVYINIFTIETLQDNDETEKPKRFGEDDYHMLRFARSPDNHLLRFARNLDDDHMLRFTRSNEDHMLRFARAPYNRDTRSMDEHMLRFTK